MFWALGLSILAVDLCGWLGLWWGCRLEVNLTSYALVVCEVGAVLI